MMQSENFDKLPDASPPDVWFVYRTNPAISFWDTKAVGDAMAKFPFMVCFAYTRDETNHVADVLLPDCTDLEGLQLLRIGGTKYVEQFWDHQGFALACAGSAAARRGQGFHLDSDRARAPHWSARGLQFGHQPRRRRHQAFRKELRLLARAGKSARCRDDLGRELPGRQRGNHRWRRIARTGVVPRARIPRQAVPAAAVVPLSEARRRRIALRAALPGAAYFASARSSAAGLHEQGIHWWDKQLGEYEALPRWHDLNALWENALAKHFQVRIADYPFWLDHCSRSMQYSWGGNVGIQLIKEVADNVAGHGNVVMNQRRRGASGHRRRRSRRGALAAQ